MITAEAWNRLMEWLDYGTGGGRHVEIELIGHHDGEKQAVLTLKEWPANQTVAKPMTVTTKRFNPTSENETAIAVEIAIARWGLKQYDHTVKDEDE